jgi:hypothetical protein
MKETESIEKLYRDYKVSILISILLLIPSIVLAPDLALTIYFSLVAIGFCLLLLEKKDKALKNKNRVIQKLRNGKPASITAYIIGISLLLQIFGYAAYVFYL